MTRMEAIRNQYQQQASSAPSSNPALSGRASRPHPRNLGWKIFWLVLLLAFVGWFFGTKGTLKDWLRERLVGEEKTTAAASAVAAPGVSTPSGKGAYERPDSQVQVTEAQFKAFIEPTPAEYEQLCEYVRNSPHVRENAQYAEIMKSVRFFYNENDNAVNAYASLQKLDKNKDDLTRVIIYLGGAARFGRAASLAVASELTGDKGAGGRFIRALQAKDLTNFSTATALRILQDAGLVAALVNEGIVAKARSVSAGLMLGIIAHEAGHQSLGHLFSTSRNDNLEISRNQEREADSFASSVIATSPFAEYILAGTLFWHYAMAQQQGDQSVATTHPLSKERFENFVRANAELAAAMGITLPK